MRLFGFIILAFSLMIGCQCKKEEINAIGTEESMALCYEFIFPVTLIFPEGSQVVTNSEAELSRAKKHWFIANPSIRGQFTYAYPLEVNFQGAVRKIFGDQDLADLEKECELGE